MISLCWESTYMSKQLLQHGQYIFVYYFYCTVLYKTIINFDFSNPTFLWYYYLFFHFPYPLLFSTLLPEDQLLWQLQMIDNRQQFSCNAWTYTFWKEEIKFYLMWTATLIQTSPPSLHHEFFLYLSFFFPKWLF